MDSEPTVAIVAPNFSERSTLQKLLVCEGFPVDAFSDEEGFVNSSAAASYGCLIVDLDHAGDASGEQSLISFATGRSRKLPVIAIASDPARLPKDPLLPGIAKSAGDTRLLYLVYGALSEPASHNCQGPRC